MRMRIVADVKWPFTLTTVEEADFGCITSYSEVIAYRQVLVNGVFGMWLGRLEATLEDGSNPIQLGPTV